MWSKIRLKITPVELNLLLEINTLMVFFYLRKLDDCSRMCNVFFLRLGKL